VSGSRLRRATWGSALPPYFARRSLGRCAAAAAGAAGGLCAASFFCATCRSSTRLLPTGQRSLFNALDLPVGASEFLLGFVALENGPSGRKLNVCSAALVLRSRSVSRCRSRLPGTPAQWRWRPGSKRNGHFNPDDSEASSGQRRLSVYRGLYATLLDLTHRNLILRSNFPLARARWAADTGRVSVGDTHDGNARKTDVC